MNSYAIFSKTGKGVQEANGKTSLLQRGDRLVLQAIDGRITVAELGERFSKITEDQLHQLMERLERDGFIRMVETRGATPIAGGRAVPQATPTSGAESDGADLDFTQSGPPSVSRPPVDLAAQARADAERRGRDEALALQRMREEAAARTRAERDAALARAAQAERDAALARAAKAERDAALARAAQAERDAAMARAAQAERDAALARAAQAEREAALARAAQAERDAALARAAQAEREAAVARAQAEADAIRVKAETEARVRAEVEARLRAEMEAKLRAETEARMRAEAEAKARDAAQYAAPSPVQAPASIPSEAEFRARIEAETRMRVAEEMERAEAERRGREQLEREQREREDIRRREEEAARLVAEEEARKRLEAEDLKQRELREREELRRREEVAARLAAEDEARKKREAEEVRQRELDERRRREEAAARLAAEQEARKKREAEELKQREQREWDERRRREEERRRRDEEAARLVAEQEARRKQEEEERKKREAEAMLADVKAFARDDTVAARAQEEADRKLREDQERRAAEERKAREDAESKRREESARRSSSAGAARAPDSVDRRTVGADAPRGRQSEDSRFRLEAEQRRKEEEARSHREGERKRKEEEARIRVEEERRREEEQRKLREEEDRRRREEDERRRREDEERKRREREESEQRKREEKLQRAREKEAKKRAKELARQAAEAERGPRQSVSSVRWGAYIVRILLLTVVGGVVALHLVPFSTESYEQAAKEATGLPVKIGSLRVSLIAGPQLRFEKISVGTIRIGAVRLAPEFGSLFSGRMTFARVEVDGAEIPQEAIAQMFLGSVKAASMKRAKIVATKIRLVGPVALPELDANVVLAGDGAVKSILLQGPDKLQATLERKGDEFTVEVLAGSFAIPFGAGVVLTDFGLKANAGRQGLVVKEWNGFLFEGVLSGSARINWSQGWNVDGDIRARNVNAGVFAPALVASGKAEGRGVFSMSAREPANLFDSARIQGDIKIERGVLGSIDLSRAIQTGGKQSGGRTEFGELKANIVYDRGVIAVRGLSLVSGGAGANGTADIARGGALSGRIVAEFKAPMMAKASFNLAGTIKEPVLTR